MRYTIAFLLASIGIMLLGGSAEAFLAERLNLKHHVANAELVFDGKVMQISPISNEGRVTSGVEVTFRVDRVLKGVIQVGSVIVVRYPSGYNNIPEQLSGYDLVLLRKEDISYVFARPPFSTLPVSEVAYTPYTPSSNVEDNIRWEIINSLKSPCIDLVKAALTQVTVLSKDDVATHVKPLVDHKDPVIQSAVVVALARMDDIQPALRYLRSHPELDLVSGIGGEIALALDSSKPGQDDIPAIAELLNSKSAMYRELASRLLRASGDGSAVLYLKSSLDDLDPKVRYNAVMGLARIANDSSGHAPAYSKFLANEQFYIDYWKMKTIP